MDLVNVKLKDEFKSYKALAIALNEKVKGGNAKKAQMTDWSRYFELSKNGNRFTIEKIYDIPTPKMDDGNNQYSELIQLLILDLLVQNDNCGKITITKNNLLRAINMVNINYTKCEGKVPALSVFTNISETSIYDFYNITRSNLRSTLDNALKKLRDKALAIFEMVTFVCVNIGCEDGTYIKDYRPATDLEKAFILQYEGEVLDEMKFKKISDVRVSPRWNEFKSKIKEKLWKNTPIDFYYSAYDIAMNEERIYKEYDELLALLLPTEIRNEYRKMLNDKIMNKTETNTVKRIEVAKDTEKTNKYIKERLDTKYLANNEKLIQLLIRGGKQSIVFQMDNKYNELKREEKDVIDALFSDEKLQEMLNNEFE